MLIKLLTSVLPVYCVGCGDESELICASCKATFCHRTPSCFYCNKLTAKSRTCASCYRRTGLAGASIPYRYEGVVEHMIMALKYNNARDMADILADNMLNLLDLSQYDLITFVGADGFSRRRRGYNQAQLLARALSRRCNIPLVDCLGRSVHSGQIGLGRRARFEAVKDNFYAKNIDQIVGKRILLIDDVLTTGATMAQCANTLRQAGARMVWGVAVAKK